MPQRNVVLAVLLWFVSGALAHAGIHRAPVVIPGFKIKQSTGYPLDLYRMYRTGSNGEAVPVPFQIDEINQAGDYVLEKGPMPNTGTGNGVFNVQDELSFMGDDVGMAQPPTTWVQPKPKLLFEIRFSKRVGNSTEDVGALYLGVHISEPPPPLVPQKYVIFDADNGTVSTSRYRYDFDKKNYLVVKGVQMLKPMPGGGASSESMPIINTSTFYMKADLKYFLTFIANHRSVDSKLEAYKSGPVRSIVRVTFVYTILKLNFELGMYTEVSFFTNSVILPAVMYNPINGAKTLNAGSGFYYGFTLHDNPASLDIQTNIQKYTEKRKGLLDVFKSQVKLEPKYWVTMMGQDRMMFVEIIPSKKMLDDENIPYFFQKNASGADLAKIDNTKPAPLGDGPVNLGLYFDLTKFSLGEHLMAFRLFFENKRDEAEMETFKNLNDWYYRLSRI